jgi:hypothetical protein
MMLNLFPSESSTINERRNEQGGRKHRTKDGSIDKTKYVKGNNLVHLSYVANPCMHVSTGGGAMHSAVTA